MSLEIVEGIRGISVATLEKCGVRWVDDDDYSVRIPYRHYDGEWYERKLLDPTLSPKGRPKVLSPKNAEHHLYNPLRLGPNAGSLVFCEGEYDTLSVIDCGYPAVGTQGTNTFRATWARLFTGATVVIAFDGDAAGIGAAHALHKVFRDLGGRAYIMEVGEEEDLNDLHQRGELKDYIDAFIEEQEIEWVD